MTNPIFLGFVSLLPGAPRGRRKVIDAVYAEGVLRPVEPVDLADGPVRITVLPARSGSEEVTPAPEPTVAPAPVVTAPGAGASDTASPRFTSRTSDQTKPAARALSAGAITRGAAVAWALFGLGMLVYLVTRLWQIAQFPIYFFTDEAANPLFAQDLIAHGFRNAQGDLFPIYFEVAGNRWGPLFSVYIHAISMTLFGKAVVITRGTQAIVSALAPLAVALILKQVFKARIWWAGALLLAVAPAWFLHSRTGFETVMMAAFFACFLWCYLLYRTRSPRYLLAAILFGGLTFYTYSSGQMIMASVGAALALSDIRYHLKHWRTALSGLGLVVLLALPALYFRAAHPEFMTLTLRTMDSYWFHDLSLAQKIEQFIRTWAHGLSPVYWFIPNDEILVRHRMVGYGNLSAWLLPFFAIGAGWCLWHIKSPAQRAVLLTALVTPMGAALVAEVGITRVLAFTVPASLLIALGLDALLEMLARWLKLPTKANSVAAAETAGRRDAPYWLASGALFIGLAAAGIGMARDALVNGPMWSQDYGLYGMQYGATQLFGEAIPDYLRDHPEGQVMVSPTWANGTENFVRFFLSEEQQARVRLSNVDYFMVARRELTPDMLFVMTSEEYGRAQASGKFKAVDMVRTLPYPDGSPGFYLARLTYADNLDALLAEERAARSRPVQAEVMIDGQAVQLLHSQLDMGAPPNLFDGDAFTLVRGLEANPLVFDLTFSQPRPISSLRATFASMDFALKISLYADAAAAPVVYEQDFRGLPPDPTVDMAFERGPAVVARLRLEVLQLNIGGDVHIHVRELKFQ